MQDFVSLKSGTATVIPTVLTTATKRTAILKTFTDNPVMNSLAGMTKISAFLSVGSAMECQTVQTRLTKVTTVGVRNPDI